MTSYANQRSARQRAFRNQMLNTAYVSGIARMVTETGGYIQQSNNLNQMIPFVLAPKYRMESWVRDGVAIKVWGRIFSGAVDGEPIAVLSALQIKRPDVMDMPPRANWEREVRLGTPTDEVRPQVFGPDVNLGDMDMSMGGIKLNSNANVVEVAGFLAGYTYEPRGQKKSDGTETNGCLTVVLRQSADKSDLIPVRIKNKPGMAPKADTYYKKFKDMKAGGIGMPVLVYGQLRVRIKNTGEPADEKGVLPVRKYPYIEPNKSELLVASPNEIQVEPDWAAEMHQQAESARQAAEMARKGGGKIGTKTLAAEELNGALPQASASAPAPAPVAAPAEPKVLDEELQIDPSVLAALHGQR